MSEPLIPAPRVPDHDLLVRIETKLDIYIQRQESHEKDIRANQKAIEELRLNSVTRASVRWFIAAMIAAVPAAAALAALFVHTT